MTDRQKPDDEDAAALKLGPRESCRILGGSHLTLISTRTEVYDARS